MGDSSTSRGINLAASDEWLGWAGKSQKPLLTYVLLMVSLYGVSLSVVVRVLPRNRTNRMCIHTHLFQVIGSSDHGRWQSKICRVGWQAGETGRS